MTAVTLEKQPGDGATIKMQSRCRLRIRATALLALFVPAVWAATVPRQVGQDWAERDVWQRPGDVLDALGIRAGSVVADVGAGPGYFTFKLADRVGPGGKVYAEDILQSRIDDIRDQVAHRHLTQVEAILGTASDPRLPAGTIDAILVVNAFHEMVDEPDMLRGMDRALKPGGVLAIIDAKDRMGRPRSVYQRRHTLPEKIARQDVGANGFRFVRKLPGFADPRSGRAYYFLLFEKPTANPKYPSS